MMRFLRLLVHPILLSILGLIVLSLLIWYVAPYFAFGRYVPFEPEPVRYAVIATIVLLWLASRVWRMVRAKRRDARLIDGMAKPMPKSKAEPTAAQREAQALDNTFRDAIALLKKVRISAAGKRPGVRDLMSLFGRQYLYQLPWYIFIGAPGSGKTTALIHSGLTFPLAEKFGTAKIKGVGGTRNCDWWFTDEAVLLDTAGRYTTQESDREGDANAWNEFLQLLKRSRPRRPINGVLLTVSVFDLLQQSAMERDRYAEAVRARIQELREAFQTRFPIYLLVTKTDLLAGFNDFFGALGKEERAQVWGVTFPFEERGQDGIAATLAGEFDLLRDRLLDQVLEKMQAEHDVQRRALVHAFPQQFGNLRPLLVDFVDRVFAASKFDEAPMLRGVYFTSGTQEGNPIDRVMGTLARTLRIERKLVAPPAASGRSYFLETLLKKVVFAEQGIAGTNLRWERRRTILQWSAYAAVTILFVVVAAAWFVSYGNNRRYVDDVAAQTGAVAQELNAIPAAANDKTLVRLLPILQEVHGLADTGNDAFTGLGLSQRHDLAAASEQAYDRLLHDAFLPRIAQQIEDRLRSPDPSKPEDTYETLKAYLMMHDRAHLERAALRTWILDNWDALLPRDLTEAQHQQVVANLDAAIERGDVASQKPLDKALVDTARGAIRSSPFPDRVYRRLTAALTADPKLTPFTIASATKDLAPSAALIFNEASQSQSVPGRFTREGFRAFNRSVAGEVAKLRDEQPWVVGDATASAENMTGLVRGLYLEDYAKAWTAYLGRIRIRTGATLHDSVVNTRLLIDADSPLKPFFKAASDETTLAPVVADDKSLVDRGLDAVRAKADKALSAKQLPTSGTKATDPQVALIVDARFDALRRLVTPPSPGAAPPIDKSIEQLNQIYTWLSTVETAVAAKAPPPTSAVPAMVKAEAPRLPEPLQTMLIAITDVAQKQANIAARTGISDDMKSQFGDLCKRAVENSYPFVRSSTRDVTLDDFAHLFAPHGALDDYFQKNLAAMVDTSTKPWSFKRVNDQPYGAPGNLVQFQRAAKIRDVFFGNGGATPSLRLEFRNVSMDDKVENFLLDAGGAQVTYRHGAVVPQTIQWPAVNGSSQVRLVMMPAGPSGQSSKTFDGPWALFHLFDQSHLEIPNPRQPEILRVAFQIDGRKAEFEVHASSVQNPFGLDELQQFRCPLNL